MTRLIITFVALALSSAASIAAEKAARRVALPRADLHGADRLTRPSTTLC
jgi:hypothetical protein